MIKKIQFNYVNNIRYLRWLGQIRLLFARVFSWQNFDFNRLAEAGTVGSDYADFAGLNLLIGNGKLLSTISCAKLGIFPVGSRRPSKVPSGLLVMRDI